MAKKEVSKPIVSPPGRTAKAREDQLINLAMNLAEQRLRDGTASSAEIVHFLKLASPKEQLEREILVAQKTMLEAKTRAIEAEKNNELIYEKALNAMRNYAPSIEGEFEEIE